MLTLASQIESSLATTGLSRGALCVLYGKMSEGALSQKLNGLKVLTNEEGLRLIEICREVEAAIESARPYPLDLKNVLALKDLLRRLREERDNPPLPPDETDFALMVSPEKVAEQYGWTKAELLDRMALAQCRFDFQIRQMKTWNRESAEFRAVRQEEHRKYIKENS